MPAQKRHSPSENLLNDDSSLQQQHHRRHQQSRWERGAEQQEEEEQEGVERDPDDEEVKEEEDDDDEEEEEEEEEGHERALFLGPFLSALGLSFLIFARRLFCVALLDVSSCIHRELAFHEEEKTRNKQIQASIAQISQRQSEALVTRRKAGKEARLPRNSGNSYPRRRRNTRGTEPEGSDDNEDENNHYGNKDSSSSDDRGTETKRRRYRKRAGAQPSQPSPSAANSEGGAIENDLEASRESKGTSCGPVNPEMLAWGKGGARSKSVRNTRIMKLTKYLENLKEKDDKLDVNLMLISLEKQRMQGLRRHLYLCCPPGFSVECLKDYVAHETQLRTEDIEILLVKKFISPNGFQTTVDPSTLMDNNDVLQIVEGQETLAGIRPDCASNRNHLVLAYRLKERYDREPKAGL
ncbi:hypothetical protein RHMOL_Rhmol06G0197600 [Rhododendron molle]|uniref:Uncharacterized protein n=1 Tax=Rhododendron molle TaxID=49168 RepID=A0ACC0NFE5_RHOML|nr:hypothetical protein RHMOL_Rhmol06G0197600 [Rhododendron molle]